MPARCTGEPLRACDLLGCHFGKDVVAPRTDHLDGVAPAVDLGGRSGRDQDALGPHVSVNAVLIAEIGNGVDCLAALASQALALFFAVLLDQCRQLQPPGAGEAAVAPTGARPADIRLDERHIDGRIELLDLEGRPESGVSATDDADVGNEFAGEWLDKFGVGLDGERLFQPKRTLTGAAYGLQSGHGSSSSR